MQDNLQIAIEYANNCISGKIPACLYVKQAAQRFLSDLNNPCYYYNKKEVDKVILFINSFNLTEQQTPKKFLLEPWQTFIIANLYGLYTQKNLRKYNNAYIELARKNGKSQLITILALYHLLVDTDAQVIISANSREQAKNVDFKKIKQFASQIDQKQKHIKQLYNKIVFGTNEIIVTAADASRLDGLNSSFVLIDELHEAKDSTVYNVLKSSQGARTNALFITITTAGFSIDSFCYQQRTYCSEVLNGSKKDESLFSIIYTLDKDDDITNTDNWIKANPNLDISLNSNWLESEVNKAQNNNIEKAGVLVKNFNIWQKSNVIEQWIDEKYFKAALQPVNINDDKFKDIECFVGVDLAAVSDITAVSVLFQLDDKFYFFNRYYLPQDTIEISTNREIYKQAIDKNELIITAGNVCDYDYILNDIMKIHGNNFISQLLYDRWNSTQFAINATAQGLNLQPFSQTAGSLNKPLKEFERLIKQGNIIIEKNSITAWMLNNVQLTVNKMGNYSINKAEKNKKIDGVAAMINALGGYLESPRNINIW